MTTEISLLLEQLFALEKRMQEAEDRIKFLESTNVAIDNLIESANDMGGSEPT